MSLAETESLTSVGTSATTAQGSDIAIAVQGDTVMINNARVTQADVMASNGVIHVIDTVIVPSA